MCTVMRETELKRQGATHITKPPSQGPAVPFSPEPDACHRGPLTWLRQREATIVRVSPFVNPQSPTLKLTGVAKQQLAE